jgi:hypothetical protein
MPSIKSPLLNRLMEMKRILNIFHERLLNNNYKPTGLEKEIEVTF